MSSTTDYQGIKEEMELLNNNIFRCKVCNISMTGIIPAQSHLQGSKHKKAQELSKLSSVMGRSIERAESPTITTTTTTTATATNNTNTTTNTTTNNNSSNVEEAIRSGIVSSEKIGTVNFLRCSACDKPCSGTVPMEQHLASEAHAKKIRLNILSQKRSTQEETMVPSVTSVGVNIPTLADDVDSDQDEELFAAMKEGKIKVFEDETGYLMCVVCNIMCNGRETMKEHLMGKQHLKMCRMKVVDSSMYSPRTIQPSTLNNKDSIIPPPPLFKDQEQCGFSSNKNKSSNRDKPKSSPTSLNSSTSSITSGSSSSTTTSSNNNSSNNNSNSNSKKPSLPELMRALPDIKIYGANDKLTDLFD